MPLVCSSCDDIVDRSDSHRNRYGELICKRCQGKGVKSTWRGRMARHMQRTVPAIWMGGAFSTVLALLAWAIYVLFIAAEPIRVFQ